MKVVIALLSLMISGAAFAGETQVNESRDIENFEELAKGDVVKINAGLRLLPTMSNYQASATRGTCTFYMENLPHKRGEAYFDTESEWKVIDAWSSGNRYVRLQNIDNASTHELRLGCSASTTTVELLNAGVALVSAQRPRAVLVIRR